jgi:hypothetical protein
MAADTCRLWERDLMRVTSHQKVRPIRLRRLDPTSLTLNFCKFELSHSQAAWVRPQLVQWPVATSKDVYACSESATPQNVTIEFWVMESCFVWIWRVALSLSLKESLESSGVAAWHLVTTTLIWRVRLLGLSLLNGIWLRIICDGFCDSHKCGSRINVWTATYPATGSPSIASIFCLCDLYNSRGRIFTAIW